MDDLKFIENANQMLQNPEQKEFDVSVLDRVSFILFEALKKLFPF